MGRSNSEITCIPCNNKNSYKILVNKIRELKYNYHRSSLGWQKAGVIAGKKEQRNVTVVAMK